MPDRSPIHPDHRNDETATRRRRTDDRRLDDGWTFVEFRPARWLLAALALTRLWLVHGRLGKAALFALAWRLIPRRLKLIAGAAAAFAFVLLVGTIAAAVVVIDHVA